MIKLLSAVLSFSLLFASVAPSYAQAADAAARTRARVSMGLDQAVRAQVRNGKFAVSDKVAEVKAVVKALTSGTEQQGVSGELSYNDFKTAYETGMKEVLAVALGEAKTEEERTWVKGGGEVASAAQEEARAYLKQLGREIIAVYKANRKAGLELITEALPVFMSVGAIDGKVRAEGAAALRRAINAGAKSCGGVSLISGIKARFGRDGDVKEQAKCGQ